MTNERIKELMAKRSLTKKDRDEIMTACNEAGITIANTGCPNCWHDALAQLYKGANVPRGTMTAKCIDGWRVRDEYAGGFSINYKRMDSVCFDPEYLIRVGAANLIERCK